MKFSHEYIGALALLVVGILQLFGVAVEQDTITGIVTGVIAVWIAVRRVGKGDITVLGRKV
jgi:uncharacterized membrane protein